ncbi:unnamed protein product [Rotaria socialis]
MCTACKEKRWICQLLSQCSSLYFPFNGIILHETSFDRFDECIKKRHLQKYQNFFISIFDHKSSIIMFILFGLFLSGALNRQSGVFQTASDVFHVLRDDLLKATMKIWSSFQLVLVSLYRVITVVKVIEIIVIVYIV